MHFSPVKNARLFIFLPRDVIVRLTRFCWGPRASFWCQIQGVDRGAFSKLSTYTGRLVDQEAPSDRVGPYSQYT